MIKVEKARYLRTGWTSLATVKALPAIGRVAGKAVCPANGSVHVYIHLY